MLNYVKKTFVLHKTPRTVAKGVNYKNRFIFIIQYWGSLISNNRFVMKQTGILAFTVVLLALSSVYADDPEMDGDVLVLTEKNFDQVIQDFYWL